MNRLDVVSVGPGPEEFLTPRAARIIAEAEVVFAAERHAGLAGAKERRPLLPLEGAMADMERALREGRRACVLLSGDAGLCSLLPALRRRFGDGALRVCPGVSSVQLFCARLGEPWQDAAILSAHGRGLSAARLCHAVRTHARTIVLLDGTHTAAWIRGRLEEGGLEGARLTVGANLGYPSEIVTDGREADGEALALVRIENRAPRAGLPAPGLPDEAFIRAGTPMTKRAVRVQIVSMLRPPMDAVVWDVGAGTGAVTAELARQCPLGEVFAVEREEEAQELIARNAAALRLTNVRLVCGRAPEALSGLPAPTHVFLGGSGGAAEAILDALEALPAPVRVCASAVTLESAALLNRRMSGYADFEALQLAAAPLRRAGGLTMMRAENPVMLFAGRTEGVKA